MQKDYEDQEEKPVLTVDKWMWIVIIAVIATVMFGLDMFVNFAESQIRSQSTENAIEIQKTE